jgi:hypothetical protein
LRVVIVDGWFGASRRKQSAQTLASLAAAFLNAISATTSERSSSRASRRSAPTP